ncbi:uncharacterized protein DUF3572 [Rhodopseudomonas faecalis]|uniref:Uncharacterized protein DUF3572 n=1 Tax=Rhodopseudomonas faecalis TaxID=99655 RepID=A0A318THQ3_9BRAD|nr:DUF3572 domain-containing protein [Rhodopseudomonas faecalis]PYF03340.1 uncharacterized protein DUF3572 [Rhodopseudomonas faecalis]
MPKPPRDARQMAEIVAVQALSFLASQPERLARFLAETGIGPSTLRSSAADPQFLTGVLDFLLRDDEAVQAFAAASGLHPTTVAAARQALDDHLTARDVP